MRNKKYRAIKRATELRIYREVGSILEDFRKDTGSEVKGLSIELVDVSTYGSESPVEYIVACVHITTED